MYWSSIAQNVNQGLSPGNRALIWGHYFFLWLPRPRDSPGKNTGVGCHFLLQCMKVKSESEVAQSCLTLSDPMDCSLPGSFIHGIFSTHMQFLGSFS